MPPPNPRDWLLQLEQAPELCTQLVDACEGIAIAAFHVARAKLIADGSRYSSQEHSPPSKGELYGAALWLAQRTGDHVPPMDALKSEVEAAGFAVI